ncbi:unnamed protein product [Calypogeia fissa]
MCSLIACSQWCNWLKSISPREKIKTRIPIRYQIRASRSGSPPDPWVTRPEFLATVYLISLRTTYVHLSLHTRLDSEMVGHKDLQDLLKVVNKIDTTVTALDTTMTSLKGDVASLKESVDSMSTDITSLNTSVKSILSDIVSSQDFAVIPQTLAVTLPCLVSLSMSSPLDKLKKILVSALWTWTLGVCINYLHKKYGNKM